MTCKGFTVVLSESSTSGPQAACPGCNGVGSIVMSLCCGRGCATCPGDQAMEAVQCYRCGGTGRLEQPAGPTA
jgi:hypothetical protein